MLSTLGLTAVLGAIPGEVCDECPPYMMTAPSDNPCGFECVETVYNCDACPSYMLTVPADNDCGFDCLDYDWEWHGKGHRRRRLEEKLATSSRRRAMPAWPDWAGSSSWPAPSPSWPAPSPSWPAPAPSSGGSWPAPSPSGAWPAPAPVTVTGGSKWHDASNNGKSWTNTGPDGSSSGWNKRGHHNEGFQETRSDGGFTNGNKGSWHEGSGSESNNANGWHKHQQHNTGDRSHLVHHDPRTGTTTTTTEWGTTSHSKTEWGTHAGRRLETLEQMLGRRWTDSKLGRATEPSMGHCHRHQCRVYDTEFDNTVCVDQGYRTDMIYAIEGPWECPGKLGLVDCTIRWNSGGSWQSAWTCTEL